MRIAPNLVPLLLLPSSPETTNRVIRPGNSRASIERAIAEYESLASSKGKYVALFFGRTGIPFGEREAFAEVYGTRDEAVKGLLALLVEREGLASLSAEERRKRRAFLRRAIYSVLNFSGSYRIPYFFNVFPTDLLADAARKARNLIDYRAAV